MLVMQISCWYCAVWEQGRVQFHLFCAYFFRIFVGIFYYGSCPAYLVHEFPYINKGQFFQIGKKLNCVFSSDIWSEQSFQTDPDLPPGWKKITDMAGIYYWHIPTGTTQWERPATHPAPSGPTEPQSLGDHTASTPRKHSLGSLSPSPTPDHEVRDGTTNGYAHLTVNY